MNKKNIPVIVSDFLSKKNISISSITVLKNDASKRRYYRLNNLKKKMLLMDSSLEKQTVSKFILVSNWLIQNRFSAPSIYDKNEELGLLLLEDFGQSKFSFLLKNNKKYKLFYYKKAVQTLTSLSKKKVPDFLKVYDKNILLKELDLFLIWHLNYDINKNHKVLREWNIIWTSLLKKIDSNTLSIVLRDYHIDNIFYLAKRNKIKNIGLIDFQDALIGHPSYDLASLLQDVRTFISIKDQKILYNYYLSKTNYNLEKFRKNYLILGTQRLIKIIGVFKRLHINDKNSAYIKYLPRTWKLLFENLKEPFFSDLKDWIDKYSRNA